MYLWDEKWWWRWDPSSLWRGADQRSAGRPGRLPILAPKEESKWQTHGSIICILCTGVFLYIRYSVLLFSNKFWFKLTALAAVQGDIEIPLAPVMDLLASRTYVRGRINHRSINSFKKVLHQWREFIYPKCLVRFLTIKLKKIWRRILQR